jgi:hypothetical protein
MDQLLLDMDSGIYDALPTVEIPSEKETA